jgi:hypothetical protein
MQTRCGLATISPAWWKRASALPPETSGTAVDKEDEERVRELPTPEAVAAEDPEVRLTLEMTRQALEASGAEIERSKRLLQETEQLVDLPPLSEAREGGAARPLKRGSASRR